MSWLDKLHEAQAELAAQTSDPWRLPLERVHGKIGDDGIERTTTQLLFDILEVPQNNRGAGACRRLAKLMVELGWIAVRVRDSRAVAIWSRSVATPATLRVAAVKVGASPA